MSFDPGQSPNPYAAPPGGGYMAPSPGGGGTDTSLILGISSISCGVVALVLSCCACFGIFPGGLAIILGIVALLVPSQPGSPGKYLGIGGIVLGCAPFLWLVISMIIAAANPH